MLGVVWTEQQCIQLFRDFSLLYCCYLAKSLPFRQPNSQVIVLYIIYSEFLFFVMHLIFDASTDILQISLALSIVLHFRFNLLYIYYRP